MAASSHSQVVDGDRGVVSGPLTSTVPPHSRRSIAHTNVLVGVLLAMSLGVAIALIGDSPLWALMLLLSVLISIGVLSVAWMRPTSRSPEHHPKIDRLLDDTEP